MQSNLTPAERVLRARLAAQTKAGNLSREGRAEATAKARQAFEQAFLDAAGGDPEQAAILRKAHFTRLSYKSAVARRRAKELNELAAAAEAEVRENGAVA